MRLFPTRAASGVEPGVARDADRGADAGAPREGAREALRPFDLEDVARRHGGLILRRCRAILRDEAEAEDAAQEVFVLLLRKGQSFRGDAALTSFLYRVSTNVCLNRLRGRRRRAAREQADPVRAVLEQGPQDARARLLAMEQAQTILQGLSMLEQEIFVLRALDGLSLDEIAQVTGRSRKTIAKRLARIEPLVADILSEPRS